MQGSLLGPVLAAGIAAGALWGQASPPADLRPNVLWVFVEDTNAWMGCYGDDTVPTPRIDALARRGARFTRAYAPAPVCSATRSAVILGAMQTTFGVHNHRSSRAVFRGRSMGPDYDAIRLPEGVRTLPELFRAAGYHTFEQGKTDYNFVHDLDRLYDEHDLGMAFERLDLQGLLRRATASGKPFFGQIQLRGGKSRPPERVDRSAVHVPPYYPDVPLVREEIAHHYDCIARTDEELGRIVDLLEDLDLTERTVVFFFSDHGFRMHRHKQFLYEGGIRVPLVVAGPGVPSGDVREDLVSLIDLAPTCLRLAGLEVPAWMEGRDVFAADAPAREFVVAARDRCDYTIDRIRAVVTSRYAYLRNDLTDRPYMQPQYRDPWPVTKEIRRMAAAGELDEVQMRFYGPSRPAEEFYDLSSDPFQIHNLAEDPRHARQLARHRRLLREWIARTGDRGQQPESLAGLRCVLRRWGARCVAPEYEEARAAERAARARLPRVLILGDSISMGYTPFVRDLLWAEAVVVRPKENCQGTTYGVRRVDDWLRLEGGRWDVVWFNFGLHDLKRVDPRTSRNSNDPRDPRQAEPHLYERQLEEITRKIVSSGARAVFATTTPVPPGVRPHRDVEDPERYNAIARRVMGRHGVAVHDLHAFARARLSRIQRPGDVHFTRAGSRELAREVARRIRAELSAIAATKRSSRGR